MWATRFSRATSGRVDDAPFMVAALEAHALVPEAPAIVGRQTPSALAQPAATRDMEQSVFLAIREPTRYQNRGEGDGPPMWRGSWKSLVAAVLVVASAFTVLLPSTATAYTPHAPILITQDSDFTPPGAAVGCACGEPTADWRCREG
jgi:hypothetical protein